MSAPLLHVLTDPALSRGRSHVEVCRAALAGGADIIQLRDKSASAGELAAVGLRLLRLAHLAGKRLVVNDHLDIALAIAADGLHLGPDDMPLAEARAGWLRPKLLGGSARTLERAEQLAAAGADYLGVGPVFGTTTKPDAPSAIGLSTLSRIAARVPIPVIGIGGVDAENAAEVVRAGAAGVAVISAVVAAPDVEEAVACLRQALDAARSEG